MRKLKVGDKIVHEGIVRIVEIIKTQEEHQHVILAGNLEEICNSGNWIKVYKEKTKKPKYNKFINKLRSLETK